MNITPSSVKERFDEKYMIMIKVDSPRLNLSNEWIVGRLPEEFSYNVSSSYTEQWQNSGQGILSLGTSIATGRVLGSTILSTSRWQGSSPIDYDVPIEFVAEKNAWDDVIYPLIILQKLALPSGGEEISDERVRNIRENVSAAVESSLNRIASGDLEGLSRDVIEAITITPPGPQFATLAEDVADDIAIYLGTFMRFRYVVITSISVQMSGIQAQHGPVKATANINFQSSLPSSSELIDYIYQDPGEQEDTGNILPDIPNIG